MTNKSSPIAMLRGEIEHAIAAIDFIQSLPEGLPGKLTISVFKNNFTLFLTMFSPSDLRKARRMLGSSIVRRSSLGSDDGDWSLIYDIQNVPVSGCMFLVVRPGTVCQKARVGERTTPIYEIRCE